MAKKAEKEEKSVTMFENLNIGGISFSQSDSISLFDNATFKDESVELLSAEVLETIKGQEINAILASKVSLDIKGENKDFIEMHMLTTTGYKKVFAGQYKFIQAWDLNGCVNDESVLAIKFTFLGKENIKGSAKTVNNFKMSSHKIMLKK